MTSTLIKTQKITILLVVLSVFFEGYSQQRKAVVKEYEQVFTTYPYSDPSPVPSLTSLYPYFRYDGFTDKPVEKSWKIVELENDYIRVIITPEIGGKIWTAIEKSTNQPFIYYNHVMKFRDIAMRGPYTSGGLELNYGIIGHTPNCATPVDYTILHNDDGSVSCVVGVLDLLTRSNWRLEIRLPADEACFITQSFWYNSTPVAQPYYHWLNGGYKAAGNLEFIYPGTTYIGHDGEHSDWPVDSNNGKAISFYESNDFGGYKSYHVLGKHAGFFGGYWHDDDFGMARYSTRDDKAGKKIWIWGLSRQGMIWENLLTDTDGQYVEMQSGRLFNQNSQRSTFTPFKHIGFAPYATDIWTEYFYPVLGTEGFIEANEHGALNIKNTDGYLKVFFSPVRNIDDEFEIREGERVIYKKRLSLAPLMTFTDSVKFAGNANDLTVTLGVNKIIFRTDPDFNVLSRPMESPSDFDWESAYGLFIQGSEAMDQKMYPIAETKLQASLDKDHNYLPAIVRMAELKYRNMLYDEALSLASRALSIDAHDGGANYYYGLVNSVLGNIADSKDGFEIASMSPEYRSAAYTGLSRLYLRENDPVRAFDYAVRAIDYNRFNIDALQLMALACRLKGDIEKAAKLLTTILSYDPLNHFSRFETYITRNDEAGKNEFISMIRNELPHETFNELAVWYYNSGCPDEAAKVLSLSPETPEREYWISFLGNKKARCSEINPDLSFPFRSETGMVLEQLVTKQDDWLLKYHLALIYRDRNRIEECIKLLEKCGDKPDYAPFYAVRAEIMKGRDETKCEADLKKALLLDNQWRYVVLLANFYNRQQHYDKSLSLTGPHYKTHPGDFRLGSLHAHNLLLNKKYSEADAVLKKINILPHEGATNGREMYREVKLMQAVSAMERKNYREALKFIDEARLWPENLGVGKPYDEDIDSRLEDWMTYLCASRMRNASEARRMLDRITAFKPGIFNTVRNFSPSNTIVTAWALDLLDRKQEAASFIEKQAVDYPQYRQIQWSRAIFGNDNTFSFPENEKDAGIRIIEKLMATGF